MTQNAINNTASIMAVDNLTLDGNTLSSTDTNGDIVLFPDGTGTVSVTTAPIVPTGDRADSLGSATNSWDNVYADGLSFDDGTNILATFTDATSWTPGIAFGGGTTGITYSTQNGSYSVIGNVAIFSLHIVMTAEGTSNGDATITGFPFGWAFGLYPAIMYINVVPDAGYLFMGGSGGGGTTITCRQVSSTTGGLLSLDRTNFTNTSQISSTFAVMLS